MHVYTTLSLLWLIVPRTWQTLLASLQAITVLLSLADLADVRLCRGERFVFPSHTCHTVTTPPLLKPLAKPNARSKKG